MATLKAHGNEIGRIEYSTYTLAFFENHEVLINRGDGWKVKGKIKAELNMNEIYARKIEKMNQWKKDFPLASKFVSLLHRTAGLKDRGNLLNTIELMPDDPDGVWSTVCDSYGDNCHASIEEIVQLCRLYKLIETKKEE